MENNIILRTENNYCCVRFNGHVFLLFASEYLLHIIFTSQEKYSFIIFKPWSSNYNNVKDGVR